jgi:hypothetical protein
VNGINRVLFWMLVFLGAVAVVCASLWAPLQTAFQANQIFNGMILGVLVVGIINNFRQVFSLNPEVRWIKAFRSGSSAAPKRQHRTRLLASLSKMLIGRDQERFRLSAITMRSLLDGVRLRLDEQRDVSRYVIGLLIFLGLLGTFWGLLDTVTAVGRVITGLTTDGGDPGAAFGALKHALQEPLSGMGTAFSSSLFGLAGALVLGFLDLQAGHAQNRFFNLLEEWLSDATHLPSGTLGTEGEVPIPHYIEALLEQTADGLHNLQRILAKAEDGRQATQARLMEFTERLGDLTDQMRTEERLMQNLAKNQVDLQPVIARLADGMSEGWTRDEEMRSHMRNMDLALTRLVEEISTGRGQMVDDLKGEIRLLTRTLAQRPTCES